MNDNEHTQYDDTFNRNGEQTTIDNSNDGQNPSPNNKSKKRKGMRYAAGLAGSAAGGVGAATLFSSFASPEASDEQQTIEAQPADDIEAQPADNVEVQHTIDDEVPAWSDGEVAVAQGNYDDMSFSEAFAAARTEVGPGGAFVWHGKVYGTYLRDEWQNMSADERAEYESHFSWNHTNTEPHHDEVAHNSHDNTTPSHGGDDTEEVPVVNVLGVTHDEELDANVAVVSVDDDEVILLDIDNDNTFDLMAIDADNNGELSEDELFDIRDNNITVNDLGGYTEAPTPNDPEITMNSIPGAEM